MRNEWKEFKGGRWETEIDVRDFIMNNYTPYDGDDSFLKGPTADTTALWNEVLELSKKEREAGGVLDMDTKVVSTILSHGPGYLDKEKETIVGFQTDKPFKRALMPYGGIRMAKQACEDNGYHLDPEVEEVFTKQFDVDFIHVHAEDRYAELLAGVTEPEEKRRIIGTQFWKEFFAVAQQLETDGKPVKYLAQGTIYPDIIESGARKTGGKTATIKSHHNLIPFPEGVHFDLIEPLDHFFKDEVRALGLALGLPGHIVFRQPFPGPGLAIRIIGAVDKEKLEILKNADAIVREELDAYNQRLFEQTGERNSEHSCWQYFAVLPDIKSVGVMGDERTYQRPIILRAVESSDAMTADWAKLPYDVLARISGRIVAEVPGANRVCYDITSKPPATIEWE